VRYYLGDLISPVVYTRMSNTAVEPDQMNYSEGEQMLKDMYNPREVVSLSWEDFLKLPIIPGYANNINRIPNSFREKVTDKKGDPLRGKFVEPIPEVLVE
jgi:hypothetical protein